MKDIVNNQDRQGVNELTDCAVSTSAGHLCLINACASPTSLFGEPGAAQFNSEIWLTASDGLIEPVGRESELRRN